MHVAPTLPYHVIIARVLDVLDEQIELKSGMQRKGCSKCGEERRQQCDIDPELRESVSNGSLRGR